MMGSSSHVRGSLFRRDVVTVGVDLAKNVLQVLAIGAEEKALVRRQLRRGEVRKFFLVAAVPGEDEGMPVRAPRRREHLALGHDIRLMPPAYGSRM